MNSNFKLVGNDNDNKNNGNVSSYSNEFNYAINGMRLIDTNLSGITKPRAPQPKQPLPPQYRQQPVQGCQASYYKDLNFQTAANLASESAHYCDNMLQPKFFREFQGVGDDDNCQYQNHQPHTTQCAKKLSWNCQNVHSPPAAVHQIINKMRHSGHKHHRCLQPQMEPFTEQQKHKLSDSSYKASLDYQQHYQYYYSYFYNQKPDFQVRKDKSRKLRDGMAAAKSNVIVEDAFPCLSQAARESKNSISSYKYQVSPNSASTIENKRHLGHQVLKEKMPNNNIINYVELNDSEWAINDGEIISEFADVREIDKCDNQLVFPNGKSRNSKRKQRTQSASEAQDFFYELAPNDQWLEENVNNIGQFEKKHVWNDLTQQVNNKLPEETPKKGKSSKKQSPPVHRVLLYNNNSPRLTRLSPSNLRLHEARRARSKSPLPTTKGKRIDAINLIKAVGPVQAAVLKSVPNVVKMDMNGMQIVKGNDADDALSNNDDDYDDLDNVSDFGESVSTDTTSDSEDGYRMHVYKLTHPLDRAASKDSYLPSESSEESLENPDSLLVPSLFPNVPPYLAFSSNTCKGPEVPAELYRVLKWRVSNVMPKVVRCVLTNSGMRLVKKTNDWIGVWGKHMKSPCFKTIRPYQKINHLPGSFKIGRKDACWRNLQKQMNKHGKKDFGFMPKTYIFPRDLNVLRKHWPKYAQRNVKFIIKPPASARGAGIRVVDRWAQIPKRKPLIVQKYIERPLLINGSKFDLRLYVLVTSINPLRVFMYHNGLARFASVKYSDKSDTLNDRCMHLTNYSINKFSSNYSKNEDVNACHGHKWTIKSLWTYLANRGIRTDFLWEALRNLVLRTIMAGEQSINNMLKLNVESKYSCFELFGFDVLLDADLIPWLLEVNISPSLHSELPLDAHVKAPLVQAVLNTALYHVPPKFSLEKQKEICTEMSIPPGPICYDKRLYINYLSRAEKIKHNTYTRKTMEDRDEYINTILDNLTPDDVRCLIVAEDELARSAPLERIFPTNQTYKYLKYNDTARYYNRLLDAWETRYSNNRAEGIALLREYCEEKYHLEVPPSPAKKQLKYRARAMMVTRMLGLGLHSVTKSTSKNKKRKLICRASNDNPRYSQNNDACLYITAAGTQ